MEKKMETTKYIIIGFIEKSYGDKGRENVNYYNSTVGYI